jgi:uncharacterized repeat protein (TIGR03803 family)
VLTSLVSFHNTNGAYPRAGLTKGSDGNFYGTTAGGGAANEGTLFQVTSEGVLTSLHSMHNSIEGGNLLGGLIQGTDGRFYGTSAAGGPIGAGSIFRMSVPLAVAQTLTTTGDAITLNWRAVTGRGYQVQYTPTLNLSNWSNLGPVIIATSGFTNATDLISRSIPKRLYRILTLE